MNNKILFITVLISNIAFGAVITIPHTLNTTNTKETQNLACKSAQKLYDRGLEHNIAMSKVQNSLQDNMNTNEIMAQNILASLKGVKEADIVSFIAQESLKNQKVDLSSYETLIALAQQSSRLLLDKELLTKIEKLSLLNEQVKKTSVVL